MNLFRPAGLTTLVVIALLLVACALSEDTIQAGVATALAATQAAVPTATDLPLATPTPVLTETPVPTDVQSPTPLPIPTPSAELMTQGKRCVDRVTYDSFIFSDAVELVLLKDDHILWYVNVLGDQPILQLRYWYLGQDWIFIEEIVFSIDGEVVRIDAPNTSRDVLVNAIALETGTVSLDLASDLEWLASIESAEKVVARLSGSIGNTEVEVMDSEKSSLRYALVIYNALLTGQIQLEDIPEGCLFE